MGWNKIIYLLLVLITQYPLYGIELLQNHLLLHKQGHLYMHKRNTCTVFCHHYEMDFYQPLENYFSIETEFLITLEAINKTCRHL